METVLAWQANHQRWAEAPGVLAASLAHVVLPKSFTAAESDALIRQAVDVEAPSREEAERKLTVLLGQLPEESCIALAAEWLGTDCVFLHLLVPEVLRASPGSGRFAKQVLEWGVAYPDPSLNRPFVEAAVEQLGRDQVVERLLEFTQGVASAYYWVPSGRRSKPERSLRGRLRPFARYLRRWWMIW